MCPPFEKQSHYLFSTLPFEFVFNISNNLPQNLINSSFHINDHIILDNYINTLNNNSNINTMHSNTSEGSNSPTILQYALSIDIFSAFYATSIAAGGLVGFFKTGSKPSLIAGLIFGGLLGVGTYFTSMDQNDYYLTLGTSTVLTGLMGARFLRSGKFMPAGLVSALSLSMVVRCGLQAIKNYNNKNK